MARVVQLQWNERRWLYATGVLLLVMLLRALFGGERDTGVEQAIARHQRQTTQDTAHIARAVAAADQALLHEQALVRRAGAEQDVARVRGNRADSLRAAVKDARVPRDSLVAWENAYDARALQVRVLESVAELRDTALVWAGVRADSLHVALTVSEGRAERADSVTRLAVRGCRVAHFLSCPSRRAVGVVTAMTTAIVVSALTLRRGGR
jgi:hypothetical protein